MGDEKKPKPGLLDFIGWKDWKIPDDWTSVGRDRTQKSVSEGHIKIFFIIVNNVLTIFVQPTSGRYNLDDHDQDLSEPDHPGRHTTDIYDQYNPGKLTIN